VDALFRQAKTSPKDPSVWAKLAVALAEDDQVRPALDAALRAARNRPRDAQTWTLVGDALHSCGESDRALGAYREAIKLDDRASAPLVGAAIISKEQNDLRGAELMLRMALDRDADRADAHCHLSDTLLVRDCPREALHHARQAVRLAPEDPRALQSWAEASERLGDGEDAERALSALLSVSKNPDVLLRLCRSMIQRGDARQALQLLEEQDPAQSQTPKYHSLLGQARRRTGDHGNALSALRTAIRLDPDDATAHFELGETFRALRRGNDAMIAFEAAARLAPDRSEFLLALGDLQLEAGQTEAGTNTLLRAASLRPEDTGLRNRLAEVMSDVPSPSYRKQDTLSSDLKFVGVPELLELLMQRKASGLLHIENASVRLDFELDRGRIADVLDRSVSSAQTTTRTLRPRPSSSTDAEGDSESAMLRLKVVNALIEVMDVEAGKAFFNPDARLASGGAESAEPVDPRYALMEAARLRDEQDR